MGNVSAARAGQTWPCSSLPDLDLAGIGENGMAMFSLASQLRVPLGNSWPWRIDRPTAFGERELSMWRHAGRVGAPMWGFTVAVPSSQNHSFWKHPPQGPLSKPGK